MPIGLMPFPLQFFKDANGVGDAALQRIDRIDQQQAIVGIQLGVSAKRAEFALAQRHENLHHAVRVRAFGRITQRVRDADVRREVGPADEGRARPGIRAIALRAPHAEFQQQLPATALVNARRFGGDERLIVEMIEQRTFEDLRHRQRPLHHRQRHVGMHDAAFGNGAQRERVEVAVGAQPVEEVVVEDALARRTALAAQILDVFIATARGLHPLQERFESGVDAVPGLVRAVIGIAAEEVLELHDGFVQALAEVQLRHGELVLIGEQDAFGGGVIEWVHKLSIRRAALRVKHKTSEVFTCWQDGLDQRSG